jgi:DNA-binding XRE family transcriptional regulator
MILVHDEPMDLDWDRLGKALQAARLSKRPKLRQPDAAAAIGASRAVIQLIEGGKEYRKPTATIYAYARLLGWTEDSVDRVLAGGEPAMADVAESEAPADSKLPMRIQHELRQEGELVDTAVIPLGDGGTMVVVVKNPADATPEQRKANLSAWLEAQGELQSLAVKREPGSAVQSNAD